MCSLKYYLPFYFETRYLNASDKNIQIKNMSFGDGKDNYDKINVCFFAYNISYIING